jgi:hypothetical protein
MGGQPFRDIGDLTAAIVWNRQEADQWPKRTNFSAGSVTDILGRS